MTYGPYTSILVNHQNFKSKVLLPTSLLHSIKIRKFIDDGYCLLTMSSKLHETCGLVVKIAQKSIELKLGYAT